ncbi:MAG TPA: hypothetical protein VGL39_07625 [Jatrophihabitantaceae bacterium]
MGRTGPAGLPGVASAATSVPWPAVVVQGFTPCPAGMRAWETVYALSSSLVGTPGNLDNTTQLTICR